MEKLKISLFFLMLTLAFPSTLYASTMEVQNYNKAIGKKLTKAINDRKVVVPEYIRLHILDLSKSGYCTIDKKKARLSKPLILLLSALTTQLTIVFVMIFNSGVERMYVVESIDFLIE